MTDPEAKILGRMARLSSQGRRPELTIEDAAHTCALPVEEAKPVLRRMVRAGLLRSSSLRCTTEHVTIYTPASDA